MGSEAGASPSRSVAFFNPLVFRAGDAAGHALAESITHDEGSEEDASIASRRGKLFFILEPSGFIRQIWDCAAVLQIWAAVIVIPVWIAYYSGENSCGLLFGEWYDSEELPLELLPYSQKFGTGWHVMWLAMDIFFYIDMLLVNPITAFHRKDGTIDYEWPHILVHYLTGWFWIDFIANLPLECMLSGVVQNQVDSYNYGRAIRLLRLFGLKRRTHATVRQTRKRLTEPRGDFTYALRGLLKWFFITFLTLHYSGCSLWLVVRLQDFPADTWPWQLGIVFSSVGTQYAWSMFNVMSAMIGLSHGVFPPRTVAEAVLWLFIMIVLAVMFAILNALVITYLLSVRARANAFRTQMDEVLSLMNRTKLPKELQREVTKFLQAQNRAGFVTGAKHELSMLTSVLPDGLVSKIVSMTIVPALRRYPLLCTDHSFTVQLARNLEPMYCSPGYNIIEQGHPANDFYFIATATIDIVMGEQVVGTLKDGQCFGGLSMFSAVQKIAAQAGRSLYSRGASSSSGTASEMPGAAAGESRQEACSSAGGAAPLAGERGLEDEQEDADAAAGGAPGIRAELQAQGQLNDEAEGTAQRSSSTGSDELLLASLGRRPRYGGLQVEARLHPAGGVARSEGMCYHVSSAMMEELLQYYPGTLDALCCAASNLLKDLESERLGSTHRAMRLMLFPLVDQTIVRQISRRANFHF